MGLRCLKAMLPVLGLLLLFMGSVYESKAKCFLGLESVFLGNLVKRKAEAEMEASDGRHALAFLSTRWQAECRDALNRSRLGAPARRHRAVPKAKLICRDAEVTEQWQAVRCGKTWVKGTGAEQTLSSEELPVACTGWAGRGLRWCGCQAGSFWLGVQGKTPANACSKHNTKKSQHSLL